MEKGKSIWIWYFGIICMIELSAAFLINRFVFNDSYYHFEPSFEESRYVERNLGNSVYDILGVDEGWRDENWLGKLQKRDVEYIAVLGDRRYSNVEPEHVFSEYSVIISGDESGRVEISGQLSPMFKKEISEPWEYASGTLQAGIPEAKAREAELRWKNERIIMMTFGAAMVIFLLFLWYAGGKVEKKRIRQIKHETMIWRGIKICILTGGILACMQYFRRICIRIHQDIWPEWSAVFLLLLAAVVAVAGVWLAAELHLGRKRHFEEANYTPYLPS